MTAAAATATLAVVFGQQGPTTTTASRSHGKQSVSARGQRTGSATTTAEKEIHKTKGEILAEQANGGVTIATNYKNGESSREMFYES